MTIILDMGEFWIEQINGAAVTTAAPYTQADGALTPLTRAGHVMGFSVSNSSNLTEAFIFGFKAQDGSAFVVGKFITGIIPTGISNIAGSRVPIFLLFMRR